MISATQTVTLTPRQEALFNCIANMSDEACSAFLTAPAMAANAADMVEQLQHASVQLALRMSNDNKKLQGKITKTRITWVCLCFCTFVLARMI